MFKSSVAEAIKYLKTKTDNNQKLAVLTGAGVSVPEIPLCSTIEAELIQRYDHKLSKLTNSPNKYYQIMDQLDDSILGDYFHEKIIAAKVNVANLFLASLVQKDSVDCVLTTNFDNLIIKALFALNSLAPIYDIPSMKTYVPGRLKYPAAIYLHGQTWSLWKLFKEGQMALEAERIIKDVLLDVLKSRPLIIIGYSGNDPLFQAISGIEKFDNRVYWVSYGHAESIPNHVKKWLDSRNDVRIIENQDAGVFLHQLHFGLGNGTPEIFANPINHVRNFVNHFSEDMMLGEKSLLYSEPLNYILDHIENQDAISDYLDLINQSRLIWLEDRDNIPEELHKNVLTSGNGFAKTLLTLGYSNRGNRRMFEGNFDLAIADYNKSIEITPENSPAYSNRGMAKSYQLLTDEAILDYKKAIHLDPENKYAYYNLGNAFLVKKEYSKAIELYTKAIELDSNYSEAYGYRGSAHAGKGEKAKAYHDFTRSIELNGSDPVVWFNRANLNSDFIFYELMSNRNNLPEEILDASVVDFLKVIELEPNYWKAYEKLAEIYQLQGKIDGAIDAYGKVLSIVPRSHWAYLHRGYLYSTTRKLDKGISDFTNAIEIKPNDAQAYNYRSALYILKGKGQQAVMDINKALELDSNLKSVLTLEQLRVLEEFDGNSEKYK